MPSYSYLVSHADIAEAGWVKDNKFDKLGWDDCPERYPNECFPVLKLAKENCVCRMLKEEKDFVILKFGRKPPYHYYGKVE